MSLFDDFLGLFTGGGNDNSSTAVAQNDVVVNPDITVFNDLDFDVQPIADVLAKGFAASLAAGAATMENEALFMNNQAALQAAELGQRQQTIETVQQIKNDFFEFGRLAIGVAAVGFALYRMK